MVRLLFYWLCAFTVNVSAQQAECGGQLNAKIAGYVTSPGYPQEYPTHQKCEWTIQAPDPSQRIVLNFNPHFELERHECRYDYIELRDGDNEAADLLGSRLCGNIAPSPIISSGPAIHIKFVSDYANQGAGFSLRYEIYKTGSDDCSRNFTALSGKIESPGFPDKYPQNLDCTFIIMAKPKMEVTLQFLTFDIEDDPLQTGEGDCKYDWLDVWDGLPLVGPLIGRYCGTKPPSEIRSVTGILSLVFHTDMGVAKDGFSATYEMKPREVTDAFLCDASLGMESGRITDEQITASSSYSDGRWTPQQARLNGIINGWTPNEDTNREYIQVDLRFLKVLTGIATQGAVSRDTKMPYYVTKYKVEVSTNGEDWMTYRHGKNHRIFSGNADATKVVLNKISQLLLARYVRIRPQAWHNGISLRFELYGCQITDAPCSDMLGMLSGLISDSQITASSTRDYQWSSSAFRLVSSRSGWFPQQLPQPGEEWLQVDLGSPKAVSGVIIQGARGGDSSSGSASENKAFVRKFKVSHSMSGEKWEYIKDSETQQPMIFEGNSHYDTPEIRRFNRTPAQYIRVYPERWSVAGIGMRLEVLGCDWTGATPTSETLKTTPETDEIIIYSSCDEDPSSCSETKGVQPTPVADSGFNCSFGLLDEHDLCGWSQDPTSDLMWSFHSHATRMDNTGMSHDHGPGSGNYLKLETGETKGHLRARIVSPVMSSTQDPLCLVFRYHVQHDNMSLLRVFLKTTGQDEKELWIVKGNQGNEWKEGRIILPIHPADYQVVFEGVINYGFKTNIGIDDVHVVSNIPTGQCREPMTATISNEPDTIEKESAIPLGKDVEDSNNPDVEDLVTWSPFASPSASSWPEKEKNWLYTLDPILVTIITMSSLGVLLGAICAGLLLYCTCSYAGLSSRSSTTLENYNFELYDGIKHKVKLNQQKCCSEA